MFVNARTIDRSRSKADKVQRYPLLAPTESEGEPNLLAYAQLTDRIVSTLGLQLLHPPPGPLLIERDQIRSLLFAARRKEGRGTPFRRDLEQWLVGWSAQSVFDDWTLKELGQVVAEWLYAGSEAEGFDWLALAAKVQQSAPLRTQVTPNLMNLDGSETESLFGFVKNRFERIDGDSWRARWRYSRDGFLQEFVPFASAIDESFLTFLMEWTEPTDLSPLGRDGAVQVFSALVSQAGEDLRKAHEWEWVERLKLLIGLGATGRGAAGACVIALPDDARQRIQDNLIRAVGERPTALVPEAVGWIGKTLRQAPAEVELTDLEENLIEIVGSEQREVAAAGLKAVVMLATERAGFGERQKARLRRVRLTLEARRGYRATSQFAALLEKLPAA